MVEVLALIIAILALILGIFNLIQRRKITHYKGKRILKTER